MNGSPKQTIVLVHGAFAESGSWSGVISRVQAAGHRTVAVANPLRSLSDDAAFLRAVLDSVDGPIVLVGHSYGGAVASVAAHGSAAVSALVFVAAFAPEVGENIGELSNKHPGSTLGETLTTVALPDGTTDFYIRQELFHQQFEADRTPQQGALDAAAQRPLNEVALNEGASAAAWRDIPSWFLIPELDRHIPTETQRWMAERADAREIVEVAGASHGVPGSRPDAVADLVLRAAAATT